MTTLCSAFTGSTGTFTYTGGGTMSAIQTICTGGSFSATITMSLNAGLSWAPVTAISTSDIILMNQIPDARYAFSVTSNTGTLTAVIS